MKELQIENNNNAFTVQMVEYIIINNWLTQYWSYVE